MIIRISFFYYALRRNRKLNASPLIHCTINSSLITIFSPAWKCRFVSTLTFYDWLEMWNHYEFFKLLMTTGKKNGMKPDYIFLNWSFHSNCTICESFFFATIDKNVSRHLKMVFVFLLSSNSLALLFIKYFSVSFRFVFFSFSLSKFDTVNWTLVCWLADSHTAVILINWTRLMCTTTTNWHFDWLKRT